MPTRNVVLTDRQSTMVDALVESGRYQNASEVLRDGLRLIEQRHLEGVARLDALRNAANVGIAAFERGDFTEFADADALLDHLNTVADKVVPDHARGISRPVVGKSASAQSPKMTLPTSYARP